MSVKSNISRMTIDLPQETHKRLKALAALTGKSMRAVIEELIEDNLYSRNVPNAETLRVMKEVEDGIGLITCESLEDLHKKLGL